MSTSSSIPASTFSRSDFISDAERRGAQLENLGYYARAISDFISDAERRGALGQFLAGLRNGQVISSLMPKGVEHEKLLRQLPEHISVISSLMPKGVEHASLLGGLSRAARVISSLMPKGVEHTRDRAIGMAPYLGFHLGCRKALSTHPLNPVPLVPDVISSLMPKGVEHQPSLVVTYIIRAGFHLGCRKALSTFGSIRLSIKQIAGFHLGCRKALSTSNRRANRLNAGCDFISDAERRGAQSSGT